MAPHGAREQHLAAALDLLDNQGPPVASQLFTMQGLADAAGVHRSTIYSYWPTVTDLHDDMVRCGLNQPGWQLRLVHQDPSQPFAAALGAALAEVPDEFMVLVRAASCGYRQTPAARELIAWERAWLDRFAWWIDRHLAASGRHVRPGAAALDLAVGATGAVEGALLLGSLDRGPGLPGWAQEDTRPLVVAAARVIDGLSEAGAPEPRSDPPPDLPPPTAWPESQQALLDRLLRVHGAYRTRPDPDANRLVELRLLAQRTGVSVRWLHGLWPSAEALNTDLVEAVYRRHSGRIEAGVQDALAQALAGRGPVDLDGARRSVQDVIAGGSEPDQASPFSCVDAMVDAGPLDAARRIVDASRRSLEPPVLALLHLLGFELRPGVSVEEVVQMTVGSIWGAQRLATLHPELLERTLAARNGQPAGALAAGVAQVIRAGIVER